MSVASAALFRLNGELFVLLLTLLVLLRSLLCFCFSIYSLNSFSNLVILAGFIDFDMIYAGALYVFAIFSILLSASVKDSVGGTLFLTLVRPTFFIGELRFSGFSALTYVCIIGFLRLNLSCLLYTSPSPRDKRQSRMPSSA